MCAFRAEAIRPTSINRALGCLYGAAAFIRNAAYDSGLLSSRQAALPVVSVGNVTVGGSGKSPFVSFLCAEFLKQGRRPAILLRGYGGRNPGPHLVNSADALSEVGDEALMHQTHFSGAVSVVIARDRCSGAAFIAERRLADLVILDDGFQHRRLRRNLDIVLCDLSDSATRSALEKRWLLPAGPLREEPARAFARASCLVLLGGTERDLPRTIRDRLSGKPVFHYQFAPGSVRDLFSGERIEIDRFPFPKVDVFTAIARPERFLKSLKECGLDFSKVLQLPDHAPVSEKDWRPFAGSSSLPVLTTAKDEPKIKRFINRAGKAFCLEQRGRFSSPEDSAGFWALLDEMCGARSKRRA